MQVMDTWTVDSAGRFVGDDGFVCPANFAEFYAEHSEYVGLMARKQLWGATPDELEDRTQHLLMMLLERKVIERFHPNRTGGCNAKLFFAYIGLCLRRQSITLWSGDKNEPTSNADPIDG